MVIRCLEHRVSPRFASLKARGFMVTSKKYGRDFSPQRCPKTMKTGSYTVSLDAVGVRSLPCEYARQRCGAVVLVLMLLWVGTLLLGPEATAQEKSADAEGTPSLLSEGYAYNRVTDQMNRFQLYADSTLVLSVRGDEGPQEIRMPVSLFELVGERVEERLYGERPSRSELGLGIEDRALHLSVIQQYDLLLFSGLGGGILVLIGLSIWLGMRLRRSRREERALRARYRALQEGEERERRRVAREIHDGPVQTLHGLHLHMAAAQLGARGDGASSHTEQSEGASLDMEGSLMDAVRELRAISEGLHPASLERFGLLAALRAHARRLTETAASGTAPAIRIEGSEDMLCLSDSKRLALYRIGQEALSNAVHHAGATTIDLQVQTNDNHLHLVVRDDGTGFDVTAHSKQRTEKNEAREQLGLIGLHERADMIGATVEIESMHEMGTTIRVTCPYEIQPKGVGQRSGEHPESVHTSA